MNKMYKKSMKIFAELYNFTNIFTKEIITRFISNIEFILSNLNDGKSLFYYLKSVVNVDCVELFTITKPRES